MSIAAIFITSFFVALSGALMPGPLLTATVAYSARRGAWAGPLVVLGHSLLELVLLFLLLLGLEKILAFPLFMKIVSLLGGVVLVWMGMDHVLHFKKARIGPGKGNARGPAHDPFWGGILISVANPYWIIWWVTIGLAYVNRALHYKALGLTAFFLGHILADLAWYTFVSFTFSRGGKFLGEKAYQVILLVCGLFLAAFGLFFILFPAG